MKEIQNKNLKYIFKIYLLHQDHGYFLSSSIQSLNAFDLEVTLEWSKILPQMCLWSPAAAAAAPLSAAHPLGLQLVIFGEICLVDVEQRKGSFSCVYQALRAAESHVDWMWAAYI